jgi:FlaA1/EpsC-like NDP-sugar epimerase
LSDRAALLTRNLPIRRSSIAFLHNLVRQNLSYAQKIVINSASGSTGALDELVEQFLSGGVKYVAVVGKDCSLIEDIIDELVVGDVSDESRFILTSSHPDQRLEEVIEFARSISSGEGEPQVVYL